MAPGRPARRRAGGAGGDRGGRLRRAADRQQETTDQLTAALRGTVRIGAADVPLRASIGAATGRHGEHDPDSLLHAADMAVYAVKEARRGLVLSDLR